MGTPAYMSPEQACGQAVDKRSDIWAFGCILYELLARRRVFLGETTSDLLAAVLTREPDWAAIPPGVPRNIVMLLKRCLQSDRRRRLRDISDARLELEETLTAPPAGAETAERKPCGVRPRRSNRGSGARWLWCGAAEGASSGTAGNPLCDPSRAGRDHYPCRLVCTTLPRWHSNSLGRDRCRGTETDLPPAPG
jgi:serine/threonine protein kinase